MKKSKIEANSLTVVFRKKLLHRALNQYLKEIDDYYGAKDAIILDLNQYFRSEEDTEGVCSGDLVVKIANECAKALGRDDLRVE
jgi:hypothetical protein